MGDIKAALARNPWPKNIVITAPEVAGIWLVYSRVRKDVDTSDNRERLNSQRHVLVQAAVTTRLCHHTCHLPQRQRTGNHTSHPGSGPPQPE